MHKQLRHIFSLLLLPACISVSAQRNGFGVHDSVTVSELNKKSLNNASFLPVQQVQIIDEKKLPQRKIDSLKSEDAYWYANIEQKKKKAEKKAGGSVFTQSWFNNLLWVVIVASFTGIVIWYLTSSNLKLFRKAPEKISEEDVGEIDEDIFSLNYETEISKAAEVANYRLAVRLLYLRTLKDLSQKGIIKYGHEKTNSDYLTGLWGTRYYQGFFRLTRNFEYTWYGGFPLSGEAYTLMQKDFTGFKNSLS
jgi:hypothetical protein